MSRRSARIRAFLALGVVLVAGTATTWASWSDTKTSNAGTLTFGNIDVGLVTTAASPLNTSSLYPGATAAGIYKVVNNGDLPLSFWVSAWASGPLGAALAIKVTTASAVAGAYPSATCTGSAIAPAASALPSASPGSPIAYSSPMASRFTLSPGATSSASPAPALSTGPAVATICVQAGLPTTAASSLQGASTTVNVNVVGEQVKQP